jgi:hypothetical protein
MLMRDFFRVGCVSVLAFVIGGATAFAQVGGFPPTGAPAGGGLRDDGAAKDDQDSEPREPVAKKAPPTGPTRMSTFNRVTTTRKHVATAPPPAARASRAGNASPGAARPVTPKTGNDRTKPVNSAIPSDSTWRQTQRPAAPPVTTVRSETGNYYPGMRPGTHHNGNTASTRAPNRRNAKVPGLGLSKGLPGGKSAPVARTGPVGASGRGATPAAVPPRR